MKKFLLSFLMLVMLTPGLACAGIICVQETGMTEATTSVPPCHEQAATSSVDFEKSVMLMGDCSGAELAQADNGPSLQKPDLQLNKIFYGRVDLAATDVFEPARQNLIRGPPLSDVFLTAQTTPPLLLTTQRIRI